MNFIHIPYVCENNSHAVDGHPPFNLCMPQHKHTVSQIHRLKDVCDSTSKQCLSIMKYRFQYKNHLGKIIFHSGFALITFNQTKNPFFICFILPKYPSMTIIINSMPEVFKKMFALGGFGNWSRGFQLQGEQKLFPES